MVQWASSFKVFTNNLRQSSDIVCPGRITWISVSLVSTCKIVIRGGENGQPTILGGSHSILVNLIDSLTIRLHHLTFTDARCFLPLSIWGTTFTGASMLVC